MTGRSFFSALADTWLLKLRPTLLWLRTDWRRPLGLCCIPQGRVKHPSGEWSILMPFCWKWCRYLRGKNFQNRTRFNKVIVKIKRCNFNCLIRWREGVTWLRLTRLDVEVQAMEEDGQFEYFYSTPTGYNTLSIASFWRRGGMAYWRKLCGNRSHGTWVDRRVSLSASPVDENQTQGAVELVCWTDDRLVISGQGLIKPARADVWSVEWTVETRVPVLALAPCSCKYRYPPHPMM